MLQSIGYAARREKQDGKWRTIYMHREIMDVADPKLQVDHIDGDPLNNTRENLRIVTPRQNQLNRHPYHQDVLNA